MPKVATAPKAIKSKKSKRPMRKSRPKKKTKVILGKNGKAPVGMSMRQPQYVLTKRQAIGIM